MKLAEEMRQLTLESRDPSAFDEMKNKCINAIKFQAHHGCNYLKYTYDSLNHKGIYWEKLAKYLEDEGFTVKIEHIIAPFEEYALRICW